MNKHGLLSILMAILSVIIFFILRGPNANIYLMITIFAVLSLTGFVLAILSRKAIFIIVGVLLNLGILGCAWLLLIAMGISEP